MASKQDQEKVGGLVYKIIDTGAKGGIVVSSLGLQKGAELVAKARNIINVHLSPDSTQTEYLLQFLNQVMVGFQGQVSFEGSLEAELKRQEQ